MRSVTWLLDPDLHHLNHGSFGAVPAPLMQVQDEWRYAFERDPVGFVERDLLPGLDQAREAWAGLLGSDSDGVVMLRNTTTGVMTALDAVARTLPEGAQIVLSTGLCTPSEGQLQGAALPLLQPLPTSGRNSTT